MPKAFVVLNPLAGRQDFAEQRPAIHRHFAAHGWDCEFYEMSPKENLQVPIADALDRGFDLFAAYGGDGTVSSVAGGLAGSGVPLGILPRGTGNVLAQELGIPLKLEDALDLLVGEHLVRQIDAMRVSDRLFLINVSVGVSASLMRDVGSPEKRRFGMLAYIWRGIGKLLGVRLNRFYAVIDGAPYEWIATDVMIANSCSLGYPLLCLQPGIEVDDGQIDVCAVRARTAFDVIGIAWRMVLGLQRRDTSIRCVPARHIVTVRAEKVLPVQGDGEFIYEGPVEVKVEVFPGVVHVIVPVQHVLSLAVRVARGQGTDAFRSAKQVSK